jgi:hypothetical protein
MCSKIVFYPEAGQEFRIVFALVLILSGNFKYKSIFLALLGDAPLFH